MVLLRFTKDHSLDLVFVFPMCRANLMENLWSTTRRKFENEQANISSIMAFAGLMCTSWMLRLWRKKRNK